ncbi:hypothetical protein CC2G_004014 [Coprinopsis cinerea AmutBmut pab1-1]|nr:hypothetical protein CC2G_004014 [Coprinopsis cinerea AmutBmut pab1-1]
MYLHTLGAIPFHSFPLFLTVPKAQNASLDSPVRLIMERNRLHSKKWLKNSGSIAKTRHRNETPIHSR